MSGGLFGPNFNPIALTEMQVIASQTILGVGDTPGSPTQIGLSSSLTINTGVLRVLASGGTVLNLNINADTANYNVYTAAGNPTIPMTINLTIAAGVTVYSTSPNTPALDMGALVANTLVNITNHGTITGAGGNGGGGGTSVGQNYSGVNGGDGGIAIKCDYAGITVYLDNTDGTVQGGGAGGGGGWGGLNSANGGGAGGPGAGRNVGAIALGGVGGGSPGTINGGNSTAATISTGGLHGAGGNNNTGANNIGGDGGDGGGPGLNGKPGKIGSFGAGQIGGTAGPAIQGADILIITAGATQITGASVVGAQLTKANLPAALSIYRFEAEDVLINAIVQDKGVLAEVGINTTLTYNGSGVLATGLFNGQTNYGNPVQYPIGSTPGRRDFLLFLVLNATSNQGGVLIADAAAASYNAQAQINVGGGTQIGYTPDRGVTVMNLALPTLTGKGWIALTGKWSGTKLTLTGYISAGGIIQTVTAVNNNIAGWNTSNFEPHVLFGAQDTLYGALVCMFASGLPKDVATKLPAMASNWQLGIKTIPKSWIGLT